MAHAWQGGYELTFLKKGKNFLSSALSGMENKSSASSRQLEPSALFSLAFLVMFARDRFALSDHL